MVGIGHCKENVECIISFYGDYTYWRTTNELTQHFKLYSLIHNLHSIRQGSSFTNFKHFLRVPLFILSVWKQVIFLP